MARETKPTPQKEQGTQREDPASPVDHRLLDLSDTAMQQLIGDAKKRGYVTYEQIHSILPSEKIISEQIEDVLAMFSEMGVNVLETEDASDHEEQREEPEEQTGGELVEVEHAVPAKSDAKEPRRAPTIPCAFICAKWAPWTCFRARAKSRSQSVSRRVARP